MDRTEDMSKIYGDIHFCTKCGLWQDRIQPILGEGNINADIMFTGESPGKDEDEQGRPFVGKSGKLLTKLIFKAGLTREDVYISNICKCRPPDNRTPTVNEMKACLPFLLKQIRIIRPRVVIALGSVAAKTLLNDYSIKITKIRGKLYDVNNDGLSFKLMPTFHPSYILRKGESKEFVNCSVNDIKKAIEYAKETK